MRYKPCSGCAQDFSGQDGCTCLQCLQEEQLTALHQLKLFFLGAARERLLYKVHAAAQAAAAETLKSLTYLCLQEAGSKETASTAQAWLRKRYSRYVGLLSQLLTQGASTSLQVGALPALPAWPYRQSQVHDAAQCSVAFVNTDILAIPLTRWQRCRVAWQQSAASRQDPLTISCTHAF